jgi:hypothetical protein
VQTTLKVTNAEGGLLPLAVRSFFATPATVDVGQTTLLEVLLEGGVGPFTYTYTNLPAGCATSNTPELHCTPASSGSFAVGVAAVDAKGGEASATTLLTVQAAIPLSHPTAGENVSTVGSVPYLILSLGLIVGGIAGAGLVYLVTIRRERKP